MNKAIFIILTGTLIVTKSGRSFPLNGSDWKFKTDFYKFLKDAVDKNYTICILDNQFSISLGTVDERIFINKIENICKAIEKDLNLKARSILFNYCADKEDSFRALPNPGMFYEIAVDNSINLNKSYLICDEEDETQNFLYRETIRCCSSSNFNYLNLE